MLRAVFLIAVMIMSLDANRLKDEESPYLKQHANNPVNWYPWGREAFDKALREDKLIFLSIGYSTCHWCHVMERESFENEKIAKYLNEHFISIKVDREEYPQIDEYYQTIYQIMNKRAGGWPLTIVMTPKKGVFFSATYLPPLDRYGYKGLERVLKELYQLYKNRKDDILKSAESIERAYKSAIVSKEMPKLDDKLKSRFLKEVQESYDSKNGGFGYAPKFPHATTILTLLDIYELTGDRGALEISVESLKAMAYGGIYDQVEGAFYRYSVDEGWMIPHFEKMLYTNAELIECYSKAYHLTKNPLFKRVVKESIDSINERFREGDLFFSASDADSHGEEGGYFIFSFDEVESAFKKRGFNRDEIREITEYFGITKEGNFEGKNNPFILEDRSIKRLIEAKKILKEVRSKREYPFIDKKIQTSWNSLYIRALLIAGRFVDRSYAKEALSSLDKLLKNLYIDGVLYHQKVGNNTPKIKGYLEDYSFLISALIEAYETTLDSEYLKLSDRLLQKSIREFYSSGRWYMSSDDFRVEAKFIDSSYRSDVAVMIENIVKIALLKQNRSLFNFAKESLKRAAATFERGVYFAPYALRVYLQSRYQPIVIKSKKENLIKRFEEIWSIEYPYLLLKSDKNSDFQACNLDSCFAVGESVEEIKKRIEKEF
jgi:uncharacterized protein YyaL (SSP411 family)